ncbi:MAG: T9SS type A sorting domain-containing protein [Chitinophagaceae bacterium]|nr:MAG: T9SS type A sorting domain-containing protein [Chitinophagaceae bacterium]
MNPTLRTGFYSLVFSILFIAPMRSSGQVNAAFDIESSSDYAYMTKMFSLSGNRVGVLLFDNNAINLYLKIYNASGQLITHVNLTSQIAWNHNTHGAVTFNAIQLNNGNIFVTHVINSNSSGMQTYNARYTIFTEAGVKQSEGQLNSIAAGSSYIFNVLLEKLSDGKIVAVWRKTTGDNLTFRLINTNGTFYNTDVAFTGTGTTNTFASTYEFRLAAGTQGNFIVSAYFWNGAIRGFAFTNNGVNAVTGGATHFFVDATNVNDYGNTGLVALPNGNFAAVWWLQYNSYVKTFTPNGTTVVAKTMLPAGSYTQMIPSNGTGTEGFVLAETKQQEEYSMTNPHSGLFIHRYNQSATLQTSSQSADGWMIQPTFNLIPGVSGGFVSAATYYKSYTVDEMFPGEGMAMAEGDNDISARMVNFSMAPLPVNLLSYDLIMAGTNKVLLTWETSSEDNNSHFEVERSTDGRNYQSVGRVEGKGSRDLGANYSFTDQLPGSEITYYRLKQFDLDGRFKELGVKSVKAQGSSTAPSVYPNPVQGSTLTLLAGNAALPAPYSITDLQGRVIRTGLVQQSRQELNVESLGRGTYLIRLGTEVIKVQKK